MLKKVKYEVRKTFVILVFNPDIERSNAFSGIIRIACRI